MREKKPIALFHGQETNIHGLQVIHAALQDGGGVLLGEGSGRLHWVSREVTQTS